MKAIVVVVLLGFVATVLAELPTCPEQQTIDDNVLLPNRYDCTTFYQCVWGIPKLMHCPPGEHFNKLSKRCDWPGVANCVEW